MEPRQRRSGGSLGRDIGRLADGLRQSPQSAGVGEALPEVLYQHLLPHLL